MKEDVSVPLQKVWAVYFSATGTTKTVAETVAASVADQLGLPWQSRSFTLPGERLETMRFCAGEVVIFAVPVYAGRVPNVLLLFLTGQLSGGGAAAIPLVVYGNRSEDDALIELQGILQRAGFSCVAAGAFVGEHAFSRVLAAGRPDKADLALAADFGSTVGQKLRRGEMTALPLAGEEPLRPYYRPQDRQGNYISILKVKPVTDPTRCNGCGLCAAVCPMGAIAAEAPERVEGICIKCCACVKGCPADAKAFIDKGFLCHQHELEEMYARRAEPKLFW